MTTIALDIPAFRALFPAFANSTTYPDARITIMWNVATDYITNEVGGAYCGGLKLGQQTLALNQMTAHLLAIGDLVAAGIVPGVEIQSTVDKVSVTLQEPPKNNQWQWWLNQTPYGAQLLALLSVQSVGGFYAGGFPIAPAFRR